MQRLEVSGAVRPIYGSLGFKRLILTKTYYKLNLTILAFRQTNLKILYIRGVLFSSLGSFFWGGGL